MNRPSHRGQFVRSSIHSIEPLESRRMLAFDAASLGGSDPNNFSVINGILYFSAFDDVHGWSLWKSDGSAKGTSLVKDLAPGSANYDDYGLYEIFEYNNAIYFIADDGTHGVELWKSDGTAAGTKMLKDIMPGSGGAYPRFFAELNGKLYFGADSGKNDSELWRSDGTAAGTVMVKKIRPDGVQGYISYGLTTFKNAIYFIADDGKHGEEIWRTDGSSSGTKRLTDINPGSAGAFDGFIQFAELNGNLIFRANDGSHGMELWKTDGTSTGTSLVKAIRGGPWGSSPSGFTKVGNTVFFQAMDEEHGGELWKTDGTSAGTKLVKDITPGYEGSGLWGMTSFNGKLYVNVFEPVYAWELWKSDGTAAGTTIVKDIGPGTTESFPDHLAVVGKTLFFDAEDPTHGREVWKSDGTSAGTKMVKDISPGLGSSIDLNSGVIAFNGNLIFLANDGKTGLELWRTDGTASGTWMIKDINQPNASITGRVFNDLNRDGDRDSNEPGLAGRIVYFDRDNSKTREPEEPFDITDGNGQYRFTHIAAGNYNLRQELPAGWSQSTPNKNYGFKVTVKPNQAFSTALHGTFRSVGSINGRIFSDLDRDGRRDANEPGLANRTVFIDLNDDWVQDADEPWAVTNSNGWYSIKDLPPGYYNIRQVLPAGWEQSTPRYGYGFKVNLLPLQTIYAPVHGAYQVEA